VKFTSKLFGRALSRRIKATVLYATETGKSEMYAKKLGEIFRHAFNVQVHHFYPFWLFHNRNCTPKAGLLSSCGKRFPTDTALPCIYVFCTDCSFRSGKYSKCPLSEPDLTIATLTPTKCECPPFFFFWMNKHFSSWNMWQELVWFHSTPKLLHSFNNVYQQTFCNAAIVHPTVNTANEILRAQTL
jgi:hypothetical protein